MQWKKTKTTYHDKHCRKQMPQWYNMGICKLYFASWWDSLGKLNFFTYYSKTCVKRTLKNRQNKDLNNNWKFNEGQKYCRMLLWILQYFCPALSDSWSWKPIFGLFESDHLHRFHCTKFYIHVHPCPDSELCQFILMFTSQKFECLSTITNKQLTRRSELHWLI